MVLNAVVEDGGGDFVDVLCRAAPCAHIQQRPIADAKSIGHIPLGRKVIF